MNKDDVKMMIVSEKQTRSWKGQNAWTVPDGRCTTSFSFALELWCEFLGVT